LALIAPLGKLGRFEEAADFFSSKCVTISSPSGAIGANTSCSAVVLLALLIGDVWHSETSCRVCILSYYSMRLA